MDDAQLFERMHASLRAFYRLVAAGSRESRLIEHEGLTAAVVPVTPERSVCNGVVYERPQDLAGALEKLVEAYESAGVRAWTVWVPARDRESATLLEREGYELDADPAAMAFELERFDRQVSADVEIDDAADVSQIAQMNDAAYGYEGDFARALADLPRGSAHLYTARLDGSPVASTVAHDYEGDCCITLVATLAEARGRGLATELMTRALLDAREAVAQTVASTRARKGH
jgi:predicted GNAT family acetyltransferase